MTYTDIHSHFLFNIDDGAESIRQSLEMIDEAQRRGITHLLATPHVTDNMTRQINDRIIEHFQQVEKKVNEQQLKIKVSLGSELFYSDRVSEWLHYPWATFNNNQKYFLFELPLFDLPEGVGQFIFDNRLKGMTPILAHPERYLYLRDNIDQLTGWYRQGCLMQMNAGSLTGHFGGRVVEFTKRLLQQRLYHFIASDAHDINFRNYNALDEASRDAAQYVDESYLQALFKTNPERAIAGQEIRQHELNEEELKENWIKKFFGPLKKIKTFAQTTE